MTQSNASREAFEKWLEEYGHYATESLFAAWQASEQHFLDMLGNDGVRYAVEFALTRYQGLDVYKQTEAALAAIIEKVKS